jgi:signal transduction histidine kinase
VRTAVNRFGERYIVADGRIVQKLTESRLWVVVAYDMASDLAGLGLFARATVAVGALLWLLIVLVAWQVTKRALKPVDDIVARTARIDAPHLEQRLPVGAADDELARVARTVNRMLDRIQDGYRRERQFTGDASHEMRNPLAKMLGEIDWALSRDRAPKEYRDTLERLQRYAQGMQRLTEALLILARLDGKLQRLEIEPFDVADLAMELVGTLPPESAERLRLELGQSADPMQALGHRHLIGVLLRNLIDNALRYSPAESAVDLRIHRTNGRIEIQVEDAGPGIPPEQVALAFNRFHRPGESRSRQTGGVGLGLSIVQAVADVHHTQVSLGRGGMGGTRVTFSLPSASADEKPNARDA